MSDTHVMPKDWFTSKMRADLIGLIDRQTEADGELLADLMELVEKVCEARIAEERERCAKICDDFAKDSWGHTELEYAGQELARLIRT